MKQRALLSAPSPRAKSACVAREHAFFSNCTHRLDTHDSQSGERQARTEIDVIVARRVTREQDVQRGVSLCIRISAFLSTTRRSQMSKERSAARVELVWGGETYDTSD